MRVFARYRHELCAAYQAFAGLLAGPEELLRMGQLERSRELSLQHARLGTHLEAPVVEEGHGGRNSAKPPPAAPAAEVPAPAPAPAPAPIDLTAEGGVEAAEAAAEAEKEAAAAVAKAEAEAKAAAKDAAAPASCPLLSSHEFVLMLRWAGLLEVDLHGEEEEKEEEQEGEGEAAEAAEAAGMGVWPKPHSRWASVERRGRARLLRVNRRLRRAERSVLQQFAAWDLTQG